MSWTRPFLLLGLLAVAAPASMAQSLDLGVNEVGLSIGNSQRWTGVRINFSDSDFEHVRGLNLTLSRASSRAGGRITGLGLGLWGPRADELSGIHLGIVGVEANENLQGIGLGALGVGAGNDFTGIGLGGLGVGVGENFTGIAVGGLGLGVGESFTGIAVGGLGVGVGESGRGIMIGGLGAAVGEDFGGIIVAGIGAGVGGDFTGIGAALVGGGVGGEMSGLYVGGVGVGATSTRGITLALGTTRGESMGGLTVSAYNRWEDEMTGLAIGIVNITDELHGVQLGLVNIVRERSGWRRILPIINWGG